MSVERPIVPAKEGPEGEPVRRQSEGPGELPASDGIGRELVLYRGPLHDPVELLVGDASRPPPAHRPWEANRDGEVDDPWRLPGDPTVLGSGIPSGDERSGRTRGKELHLAHLRQRRLARRWWKAKLGKQEYARQLRRGELTGSDFDLWLETRSDPDTVIEQHVRDLEYMRERKSMGREARRRTRGGRGGVAGDR